MSAVRIGVFLCLVFLVSLVCSANTVYTTCSKDGVYKNCTEQLSTFCCGYNCCPKAWNTCHAALTSDQRCTDRATTYCCPGETKLIGGLKRSEKSFTTYSTCCRSNQRYAEPGPSIGSIIGISVGVFLFVLLIALVPVFVMCCAAASADKMRRENRIGVMTRPPPYSEVARPNSPPPAYSSPSPRFQPHGAESDTASIFTVHSPPEYTLRPPSSYYTMPSVS